jgi:protein-tyrosine-phosphatase
MDLSSQTPQKLTLQLASTASWLITMGCGDECPVVPGAKRDDWPILDPKGQSITTVSTIADDIDARVRQFIAAERLA